MAEAAQNTSRRMPPAWRTLLLPLAVTPLLVGLVPAPAQGGTAAPVAPPNSAPHLPAGLPSEDATGAQTTDVTLTEVDPPVVPSDGTGTLSVRGTVTNNGTAAVVDPNVAAREAVPLPDRSAIDEAVSRSGFDAALDGALVAGSSVPIETIEPGTSRAFDMDIPVTELALDETGAYQLAISVTGQTEDAQWDQMLGIGRTVLPWAPDADELPDTPAAELTVMWPLISRTHLSPQTDEGQTPVFHDDALLTEISPGGRLHEMVSLGADLPISWVIDPDLLASVDAMAEDYQVEGDDGPVAGRGQEVARAWLHELREAVSDENVVALPFADPDLASLAHQGRDVPGSLGHLQNATEMASTTVETVLGVTPNTDFAWPYEGAIAPEIISVATSAGASSVISRSDSLGEDENLSYTPNAARPIGGGVTALPADHRLSGLFQRDMSRPGNVARAHQLLLTHTLAIHQQERDEPRNIVLAPDRMPDAAQVDAMAEALSSLEQDGRWVGFADLTEAATTEPDPATNTQVPETADYPAETSEKELPTRVFEAMRRTQRELNEFSVILSRPDRVAVPFGSAIQRQMSTSWRGRNGEAARYRSSVENQLQELTEQVSLIPKSPITLSGRSATIPVTVQNSLVQDVENLELRLTSSRSLGLEVSQPENVTVGGGHSQSVKFEANARANGRTVLEAQLYTQDGKPYGEPIRFHAQVTSITSAVLMVIAGGLLLVALAGIRMYTQRKRAVRKATEPQSTATGTDVLEDDPDTGSGSGSATGSSEKLDRGE